MTDHASDIPAPPSPGLGGAPAPRRRWRGCLIALALALVAGVIGAELVARFVLRLGDPPLYVADPKVEYLMKPSSRYNRFYAVSTYNKWSMRCTPDIETTKGDPAELRVLVMGDSVVNGGPQTDDSQLATTLLGARLRTRLGRPVTVANISAGSWGPPNLLAYSEKFGFFGADVLVIVLNFEDSVDVPTFDPLDAEHPASKPLLALEEVVFRYLPSLIGAGLSRAAPAPMSDEARGKAESICTGALRELVGKARAAGCKVVGVLHATATEVDKGPEPGFVRLRSAFRDLDVPVRDTTLVFREALSAGKRVYRDNIHPLPEGQELLAREFEAGVLSVLR